MTQKGGGDLPEIVFALGLAGRFARRLDRRQEQRDQQANNRDHHQQLNQRESAPPLHELFMPARLRSWESAG